MMDYSQEKTPRLQFYKNFLDELNNAVEYDSGSLFVLQSKTHTLKEVAKRGDGIDFISSIDFPMGSGLSAWVAQKGKIIYLADIHRGSRHGLNPVRSYLSMPLENNNRIVGVLNLGHVIPNAFEREEMITISTLTKDLARKIYNHTYLHFLEQEDIY